MADLEVADEYLPLADEYVNKQDTVKLQQNVNGNPQGQSQTFMQKLRGAAKKYPWVSPIGSAVLAATEPGRTGNERTDNAIAALMNTPVGLPMSQIAQASGMKKLSRILPGGNIGRLVKPIHDIPVGIAQKAATGIRATPTSVRDAINRENIKTQAFYEGNVPESALSEMAGATALLGPMLKLPTAPSGVMQNIGAVAGDVGIGAAMGAATPVASMDPNVISSEMGSNAMRGGFAGGVFGAGLRGAEALSRTNPRVADVTKVRSDINERIGIKGDMAEPAEMATSLANQKFRAEQAAKNEAYALRNKLAEETGVGVRARDIASEIEGQISELAPVGENKKLIDTLSQEIDDILSLADAGGNISFTDAAKLRKMYGDRVRAEYTGKDVKTGTALGTMNQTIKNRVSQSMSDSALASGVPELAEAQATADRLNTAYKGKWGDTEARRLLEGKSADDIIDTMVSKGWSHAKQIQEAYGPEVTDALKSHMLQKWDYESGGDPSKWLASKSKNQKTADILFQGDDAVRLNGLVKLKKAANTAGRLTNLVNPIHWSHVFTGGGESGMFGRIWSKAMESQEGQQILLGLGKSNPGSAEFNKLAQQFSALVAQDATADSSSTNKGAVAP